MSNFCGIYFVALYVDYCCDGVQLLKESLKRAYTTLQRRLLLVHYLAFIAPHGLCAHYGRQEVTLEKKKEEENIQTSPMTRQETKIMELSLSQIRCVQPDFFLSIHTAWRIYLIIIC